MLHILVHVCFTYHLHVSRLVAQGSGRDHTDSCAPVINRDSCVACRPVRLARVWVCLGIYDIYAQVTSQSSLEKREASHSWGYPLARSAQVAATRYPECFTFEGGRRFSSTLLQVETTGREISRGSIRGQSHG